MLLYQIVHLQSGYKYVGQTTRPPIKRWREHLYPLRKGKHGNRYLQAAWTKYGESSFKFEIIKEYNTLEDLNKAEIELIRSGTNLYNLAGGGNSFLHSDKSKKAIGKTNKKPVVGMCVKTGEVREYASAADAAKDGFNQACVRKCAIGFVSKRKDGTTFESISHRGWVWISKELFDLDLLRSKCDIAKVAKIRKERPVIGMNIFTRETVRFKSGSDAGRNGFNAQTVGKACKSSAIHKGFIWVYGDIDNTESLLRDKALKAVSSVKRGPKSWQ